MPPKKNSNQKKTNKKKKNTVKTTPTQNTPEAGASSLVRVTVKGIV